jgi:RNA polymerase-binding transcription factor DksA
MDIDSAEQPTAWGDSGARGPVTTTGDRLRPSGAAEEPTPSEGSVDSENTVDRVDRLLDGVERALARLDDGTYGHCELCGGPIPDDRLAAEPTVERCRDCAADPGHAGFPMGETAAVPAGLVTGESA